MANQAIAELHGRLLDNRTGLASFFFARLNENVCCNANQCVTGPRFYMVCACTGVHTGHFAITLKSSSLKLNRITVGLASPTDS